MKKVLVCLSIIIVLGSLKTALVFKDKESINDSVVYIESINNESIKTGSGFVYKIENNKNFIITNYHVIDGYDEINIYNKNKEKIKANILAFDQYTDIAILTIDDELNLKEVKLGNSDNVNNNDKVFTIGTPEAIENINTKSKGHILNKDKEIELNGINFNSIEVSIDVSYGNSGSPLFRKNKVIGMMFVMDDIDNIELAYALPINFVKDIVKQLEQGKIKRPNLGAIMCNITNTKLLNEYEIKNVNTIGVVLLEVKENYTLYNSGLQKGDVITRFNNKKITNVKELRNELYKKEIGDIIDIEYVRNGITTKTTIQL